MRVTAAIGVIAALSAATESAFAEERAPRSAHTSVALLSGYGFQLDSLLSSGVSAYRFGFGTRAGVTLPFGGYVGGTFVAHVGTNVLGTRGGTSTFVAIAHDTYLGPELGYDFALWRLLLRPYVGGGALVALGKTAVGHASASDDNVFFYVAPGALAAYRFGDFFAGLDLRIPIVPALSSNKWAPAAMLVLGTELSTGASSGPR